MAAAQDEKDSYIFNRDYISSIRLNYQHFWVRQLCGYLLHPLIPVQSPELRVADVGTGTGIWPTEVSRELPHSARIDGFDISALQYPPRNWIPTNVHLHIQDAFRPFPPDHHVGTYDIVHLRFFLTLLDPTNVHGLIGNLMTLLRPGGYLQWLDCDGTSCRVAVSSPLAPRGATEEVAAMIRKPHPGADYSWIPNLSEITTKVGLQVITHEIIQMKDDLRPLWTQSNLLGLGEYASKMGGAEAVKARGLIEAMEEEIGQGTSLDSDFFCMVAQKPF